MTWLVVWMRLQVGGSLMVRLAHGGWVESGWLPIIWCGWWRLVAWVWLVALGGVGATWWMGYEIGGGWWPLAAWWMVAGLGWYLLELVVVTVAHRV